MNRRRLRKIVWPAFAAFLLAVFVTVTVWLIQMAMDAGTITRLLGAAAWCASFAFGWREFRRMYYRDELPVKGSEQTLGGKLQRWVIVIGVLVTGILLDLNTNFQVVGLALVTGFVWPAFYWMFRAFVRHPEKRERLWSGRLRQPDPPDAAGRDVA